MRLSFLLCLAPVLALAHGPYVFRTAQPPLDEPGILALLTAGVHPVVITEMLGERRCACDVSPAALARWKHEGIPDGVIAAASLHALPPNRRLELAVRAETLSRPGRAPVTGWIHLFVQDRKRTRAVHLPLGGGAVATWADTRSPLRRLWTRELQRAVVELSAPGRHEAWVSWSEHPWPEGIEGLPASERVRARRFMLDIPAATPRRSCEVRVGLRADGFRPGRARLEEAAWDCEWE